jgi:hypothetical protein
MQLRYREIKDQITIFGGGNGLNDLAYIVCMLAHNRTRKEKYLNYMQQAVAYTLGANQMGMCQVAGVGNRAIKVPLHVNSIAAGVAPPAGLIPEGYCPWAHLINTSLVLRRTLELCLSTILYGGLIHIIAVGRTGSRL